MRECFTSIIQLMPYAFRQSLDSFYFSFFAFRFSLFAFRSQVFVMLLLLSAYMNE